MVPAMVMRFGKKRDQIREDFLAGKGITVVRFWNHQIRQELDSVLQAIWLATENRRPKQSLTSSVRQTTR